MRVDAFEYELPANLIAQRPAAERAGSRLLVADRATRRLRHDGFAALPKFLRPGDLLVLNDSRVLPARLQGRRLKTGGRWEGLFIRAVADGWEMLCKTRGHAEPGEEVAVDGADAVLRLARRLPSGAWLLEPPAGADPHVLLDAAGHMPLPPYIRSGRDDADDRERYQTVYAERPGSIAAPTAGLHFTPELLAALAAQGVGTAKVTLHVGLGTFLPVKVGHTEAHEMHAEQVEVSAAAAAAANAARAAGGRIVAVGTTAVRALETAAAGDGTVRPFRGETRLFLVPGSPFRATDALLTNFHLPRSTLLMLVAAFAGREFVLEAYAEAVRRQYRFYSYGDAMLVA